MSRSASTINREVAVHATRHDGADDLRRHSSTQIKRGRYRRWSLCKANDWLLIHRLPCKWWSPGQICGPLRLLRGREISCKKIYRHIARDKTNGGTCGTHADYFEVWPQALQKC